MAFSIPESILEEIKARTDLADLISSYGVNVRRMGADYKACCPFHHEKTPSFVIHPNQGYYHCFGCGESGNVFKFVMKQEGLTFVEAAKKLAAACGVTIEEKEDPEAGQRQRLYALHAELAAFFRRCLQQAKEAEAARAYLSSRKLSDEIAERFSIGYAPQAPESLVTWAKKHGFSADEMHAAGVLLKSQYENGRPYNRFGGRLMFTIRDRAGRPVAFSGRILTNDKNTAKYVNSPETPIFKKSNILFALDQAAGNIVKAPHREAIVCEGQIDVIRCHASGFTTAVASQGTSFTEEHVQILKKCADSVVLVFDADGAGQKAAIRTGGAFLAADVPVRVATLPAGEDPDSLLRDQGPAAFQACLDQAESITRFQVRALRAKEERPDTIDALARVSRAVMETLAQCSSAILRASLMREAADLLHLPLAALEEDFAKVKNRHDARQQGRKPVETVTRLAVPHQTPPRSASAPAARSAGYDERPDDFFIDVEPPPGLEEFLPPELDAHAPVNNPPSADELNLCEFLFDNEKNTTLAGLVAAYLPEEVLEHAFTRQFVAAWRSQFTGTVNAFSQLRQELEPAFCPWLDKILMSQERAALSEMPPEVILQQILRKVWVAAYQRRQNELAQTPSLENDMQRLKLSQQISKIRRFAWDRVVELMELNQLT